MAENVIFYGPPGTGKTYLMQKLQSDYTDYELKDHHITSAFTSFSQDWFLVALVLFQHRAIMSPAEIQAKIDTLSLGHPINVSATLESHDIQQSTLGVKRKLPRIFQQYQPGHWYVDRTRLLQYEPDFFEKRMPDVNIVSRYSFVTFHQSFAYEDFIEGIRPTFDSVTKSIDYSPKPGTFKLLCEKADKHPEKEYAIFVDEINRGNISEILGELISLIEVDKRKGQANELVAELPYSKELFVVPSNLNIYGTMNSADKSIASIDIALRRRFTFMPIKPDASLISKELELKGIDAKNVDGINLITLFNTINSRIELLLDAHHLIGHSYFMHVNSSTDIINVLKNRIIPLLEQYFYDDLQKIQLVFNDIDNSGTLKPTAIYQHTLLSVDTLLPYIGEYMLEDRKRFFVNPNIDNSSLLQIYDGATP